MKNLTIHYDLTIIIPHFQRWECLILFLESIPVDSNGLNVEIIIVDDASKTDASKVEFLSILENVNRPWLKLQFFQILKNSGAPHCRNFGFDKAKGRYIHFLDSDDRVIWQNYFSVINKVKTRSSNASAFISGKNFFINPKQILGSSYIASFNWVGPLSGVLFVRNSIENTRFDESFESAQDWAFYVECYKNNGFDFEMADQHFYLYTISNDSITLNNRKFLNGRLKFYYKYIANKNVFKQATFFSGLIIFSFRRRMFKELNMFFFNIISLRPISILSILFIPFGFLIFLLFKASTYFKNEIK